MVLGKKVAIFDWEWADGQKRPCHLLKIASDSNFNLLFWKNY